MASRDYLDDDEDDLPEASELGRSRQVEDDVEDDEERDSEEEEDEEDDEEEEDEEQDSGRQRKRVKRAPKRPKAHRFLDLEVEVDDDDEDLDDDDDEFHKEAREFIDEDGGFDPNEPANRRAAADHIRYDQQRELNERDLAELAQDYKDRYQRSAARYTGDADQVPQRLLMPSVNDPHLFQVRVKAGREKELVFSLMRKYMDKEHTNNPLEIFSAFQRDSLPGLIYVEAHDAKQVSTALNGLVGAYVSSGIKLVPIDEMSSLLKIKRVETTVQPGAWVRIKRGKYAGDLAQVIDVTENGEEVGLKFIPRIDLTPRDDAMGGGVDPKTGKRKKPGMSIPTGRPPQRFFNVEEVTKAYGPRSVGRRQANAYVFMNDTYKDGFIEKDIRLSGIQTDNINPTLDEIAQFARIHGEDGAPGDVDLSAIAEASRKAATAVLQPGDHVEVFEGEQTGVHGVVESISGEIVLLRATHIDIEGQKIEVPARSVRKRFKAGDHVKVMAGKNTDETGLVVSVTNNVVTFLSDLSLQEVTVFSKDLREAAEVGASTNTVGNYELHDLVLLGADSVGVIYKTEHSTFRVLDQNGQTRIVQPHQITLRRDSNRAIATDAHGHEIRVRDNMKEVDGEMRKGQVLHIHQSTYAFLFNREIAENGGVFVTRARSLVSVAPKGPGAGMDLSKMNPAMMGGGMVGSGIMTRAPRDRLIGVHVMVTKGLQKGYVGTVKETNGNLVRVELVTGNKVISIEKDKLRMKGPDGKYIPISDGFSRRNNASNMGPPTSTPNSGANSGWGTPSGRGGGAASPGRTQNPYLAGSRTPGWGGDGSRTPFGGGKTPVWNSSATPMHQSGSFGGKTPGGAGATNGSWGGATPGRSTWGGATPGRPSGQGGWGGATPARSTPWGGATPARSSGNAWGGATPAANKDSWGGATPGRPNGGSAETPYTAPTPGAGLMSAPTPGAPLSAPTPGAGAFSSAPTPAFGSGYGSAPTPGVFGMTPGYGVSQTPRGAPTPFVSGSGMDDDEGGDRSGEKGMFGQEIDSYWTLINRQLGLPKDWLMTLPENVLVGAILEFCISEGETTGYADGAYDGQTAVFVTRLDSGARYSRTVTVKLLNNDETLGGVPYEYLKAVEPRDNEYAICLDRGHSSFGRTALVSSKDGEDCMLEVFDEHMSNPDMEFLKVNMIVKKHQT
ncbi:transcription elongation factor SPT5 [Rhizoctonia solani AG-1 IA]|uniref:Transcription elongation factor SPT5 n=1 Tax=Thanatephorus cucumeris (strain AG1-IA) TaxID=983506 RepID=L8WXR8_THACA|nr:transcription elongation factor SPT5 [Rhizoctonia solani AG-1 IA]